MSNTKKSYNASLSNQAKSDDAEHAKYKNASSAHQAHMNNRANTYSKSAEHQKSANSNSRSNNSSFASNSSSSDNSSNNNNNHSNSNQFQSNCSSSASNSSSNDNGSNSNRSISNSSSNNRPASHSNQSNSGNSQSSHSNSSSDYVPSFSHNNITSTRTLLSSSMASLEADGVSPDVASEVIDLEAVPSVESVNNIKPVTKQDLNQNNFVIDNNNEPNNKPTSQYKTKPKQTKTLSVKAHSLIRKRVTYKHARVVHLKKGCFLYRSLHFNRKNRVRHLSKHATLRVKNLIMTRHTIRLQLTNGRYVTANSKFVNFNFKK